MKKLISILMLSVAMMSQAQDVKTVVIEDGGSGAYKAVMSSDQSLPTHTVFKPEDLSKFGKKNLMPVLVWGNGACANTPNGHINFLNEIASHGFLVVAIGPMPQQGVTSEGVTSSKLLIDAIDWAEKQNADKKSQYYGKIDLNNIAAAGMSCGGLQTIDICDEPRLKTIMVCNSGLFINPVEAMPNMPMPKKDKLNQIHTPVLYMLGGESDIAYQNGMDDFSRINHVPAFMFNFNVGHGGTYSKLHGGEFGYVATQWLEWRLKGNEEAAKLFKGTPCEMAKFQGWSYEKKNIDKYDEIRIPMGNKTIYGVLSKPKTTTSRQPIAIIAHGFNSTYHFGKNYFEMFNRLGYQCFAFDFPCGSVNSQSDNNIVNMSIIDEQQALEAIVHSFQERPDIDPERVVLVGESQGGLISSLVAANKSMNIDRLVLVFPALCIPDNWNDRYKQISDIPEVTSFWGVNLGRRFFTEMRYLRPFEIIGSYEGPVQIIHGDSDQIVPVDYAHRASEIYKDVRLHVIKGAGHGFKPDEFKEELEVLEQFITE